MTLRLLAGLKIVAALPLAAQKPDTFAVKTVRRSPEQLNFTVDSIARANARRKFTPADSLAILTAVKPRVAKTDSVTSVLVDLQAETANVIAVRPNATTTYTVRKKAGTWVVSDTALFRVWVYRGTRDSVADSLQSTDVEYLQRRLSPFIVITAKDTMPMQRHADGSCDWTRYAKPAVLPPIGVMRMPGERHNNQCRLVYYRVIDKTPRPVAARADTARAPLMRKP